MARNYGERLGKMRNFLATDDVPKTLFGIPIVSNPDEYTDADLAFFRKNPEAGGYYDLGSEDPWEATPDDGTDEGAPVQDAEGGRAGAPSQAAPNYGLRPDGTPKGRGWLGEIRLPDGGVATEYSIGVNIGGREVDIPTLVPTLTREEVDLMANDIIPNGKRVPGAIVAKAVAHAKEMWNRGHSTAWADDRTSREDMAYNKMERAIAEAIPFIKADGHEGFREGAYQDVTGKWTIGYGQTTIVDPKTKKVRAVRKGDKITEEDASAFVEKQVRENAARLHREHPEWAGNLSKGALAALYDVAYNMGAGVLSRGKSPNLNSELDNADMDYDAIVWRELPTYVHAGGKVVQGLVNRRNDAIEKWKEN